MLKLKGHAAMLSANVIWGLMSPFSKYVILLGVISPYIISTLRFGGAMILFWMLSFFTKKEKVPFADLLRLFGAGMLGVFVNQSCFMLGVSMTSPGDASIITTSMPLWVMILAAFILKEPITAKKVGGIVCGASGAILLIIGSRRTGMDDVVGTRQVLGDLMVLAAQFSYALYLCLYKNFVAKYSLVTLMKWMFTFAFFVDFPFVAKDFFSADWGAVDSLSWCSLAFTVVMGTFLAYIFIMIGQKTLRPTVVGMYNYLQPIVSCFVAIYLGMDSFNFEKGIAIILIFAGVWLVTRSKSRAQLEAARTSE